MSKVAKGATLGSTASEEQGKTTGQSERAGLLAASSCFLALLLFVLSHAALWTLAPFIRNHNLPLDVIEHLAWGREWQLGYHKHPPMVSWMLEGAILLFGRHDVAAYALSQACIVISFLAVWHLARSMFAPFPALAATMIGGGVIYHSFTSPEFNVNVASLPFWALAIWLAHRLYARRPGGWNLGYWILLGLAAAGAILAKYTGALLVFCIFLLFVLPPAWPWWRTRGPYWAIGVFALAMLPHGLWLVANGFPTFAYALARGDGASAGIAGHVLAPIGFAASQLPAILPALAIIAVGWPWQPRVPSLKDRHDQALVILGLGPLIVLLLVSLVFSLELKSMWGTTLFLLLGVMAMRWLRPAHQPNAAKRLIAAVAVILFLGPIAYLAEPSIANNALNRSKRTQFPGSELSGVIESAWHQRFERPLSMVVGDEWLAGNLSFYGSDRPSAFINADPSQAPWANLSMLAESGGIVLWMANKYGSGPMGLADSPYASLTETLQLVEQPPITLPWATSSQLPQVTVNWAIIPPQEATTESAG